MLRLVGLRAELAARHDDLVARAAELRASRERLIETQDAERRRLERDIHDGAQQHLVALAVNLRLAETVATRSPERAARVLADQADAAREAIETLSQLSRGIYPRLLAERGAGAGAARRGRDQPGAGHRRGATAAGAAAHRPVRGGAVLLRDGGGAERRQARRGRRGDVQRHASPARARAALAAHR